MKKNLIPSLKMVVNLFLETYFVCLDRYIGLIGKGDGAKDTAHLSFLYTVFCILLPFSFIAARAAVPFFVCVFYFS